MNKEIDNELTDGIARLPEKRKNGLLKIAIIIIGIMGSAGSLHWLADWSNSQSEVKEIMKAGFDAMHREIKAVKEDQVIIKEDQASMKSDFLNLKTDLSEQKQVTSIVVNQLSPALKEMINQTKVATRQTQEIYNQMQRDQSPEDKRESDESYIAPITPIENELRSYTGDPDFKKKI